MDRRLVSDRFPFVPITIIVGGRDHAVDALLDTGFDGNLIVPRRLTSGAGKPDRYEPVILADGSEVRRPIFLVTVQLGDLATLPAEPVALGGDFLLGRGLIDRFRIILDHGRQIILEP